MMGLRDSMTMMSLIVLSLTISHVSWASEFQVGDRSGWVVPPANDTRIYNDWASQKRFKVGDVIRFKYRKDSVMEVNETDYKKCNSTLPNFFSNTGNTIFTLAHSGYVYFISGAAGHCEKGQRVIVKVMAAAMDQDDSGSGGPARGAQTSSTSTSVAMFSTHQLLIAFPTFQLLLLYLFSQYFS